MEVIEYEGRMAALASPERVYLAPAVDELEDGHPVLRMVALMCVYAREVQHGLLPGPYTHEAAERFARCALIPDECAGLLVTGSEARLAVAFGVPLREVRKRRAELCGCRLDSDPTRGGANRPWGV